MSEAGLADAAIRILRAELELLPVLHSTLMGAVIILSAVVVAEVCWLCVRACRKTCE